MDFEIDGRKYVGGVSFQIISATDDEILATLSDASRLPLALPLTRRARLVDDSTQAAHIELQQGTALMRASYTVRLARLDESTLRFTLDPTRDHDIRDVRGFFTAHQLNDTHSLVSVFVGVDLGSRLSTRLIGDQVQKAALAAPAHIRRYIETQQDSDVVVAEL